MAYIPNISNYKPFYIQTASDNSAIDTLTWGMVAKSNPYLALPKPKTPYKNEWKDENGLLWCEVMGCIETYLETLPEEELDVINNT